MFICTSWTLVERTNKTAWTHGKALRESPNPGILFEFNHLPPGDYVVSFSGHYGLPDTENARVIHLSDGQQVTGADIYLKGAPPAR
jgi:hypothetical protein